MDSKIEALPNVITFGAALIDIIQTRDDSFILRTGGTPVNVAISVAKLGYPVAIIASIGEDFLGEFLLEKLSTNNINTNAIEILPRAKTSIAIIRDNSELQNQDFLFYRDADLKINEFQFNNLRTGRPSIFCFSSSSMLQSKLAKSLDKAIRKFHAENALLFFDLNIRKTLWGEKILIQKNIRELIKRSHIIKANQDEAQLITGFSDPSIASKVMWQYSHKLIVITLEDEGCFFRTKLGFGYVPSFKVDYHLGDPVGTGDAFVGALCSGIIRADLKGDNYLDPKVLQNILLQANAAGAITACEKGADAVKLNWKNIEALMANSLIS